MDSIVPQNIPQKQCNGPCGRWLPATPAYFHRKASGKYGVVAQCKACMGMMDQFGFEPIKYDPTYALPTDVYTPVKRCTKCKRWIPATSEFFTVNNKTKDRLSYDCKSCRHRPPKPKNVPNGYKRCFDCKKVYLWNDEFFHRNKAQKYGYDHICKECKNKRGRESSMVPERRKERLVRQKAWNDSHKDYHQAYGRRWRQIEKNKESEKQRLQKRYRDFRDYTSMRGKAYYQQNKSTIKIRHRRNYELDRERYLDRSRRHYITNREHYADLRRAYRQTERGKAVSRAIHHRYRSRRKNIPGNFTHKDIEDQYRRQKGKCYYCSAKVGRRYDVDHIIPVTRPGATNWPDNLVIACPGCNRSKNNRLPHEWPKGGRLL